MTRSQARAPSFLAKLFEFQDGTNPRLLSMEGLRGFAVLLVFLVHYIGLGTIWLPDDAPLTRFALAVQNVGTAGVDLFFILSGYLIYGSLIRRPQPVGKYLRRRVERIYPTFLVVFALYVLLSFLFPAESKIPGDLVNGGFYLLENLLLLPGMFHITPIITVAWSLSFEFFFYLAVPALIWGLRLRRWHPQFRVGFFVALAGAILASPDLVHSGHVRIAGFIAGMLLYETPAAAGRTTDLMGLVALALGLFVITVLAEGMMRFAIICLTFYTLCRSCFSGGGLTCRMFSWTPLRWLGNMSYSYYLLHGLVLKGGFLVIGKLPILRQLEEIGFVAGLPLLFAATLLPSVLLFLIVERPLSLDPSVHRGSRQLAAAD
jgi:peptidoglycan/LPS O-acetylase OafA/YrhL